MAETQREIATLSKQIRATEGLFTGQWGRLMEALVRPGVVHLFQDWGIPVSRTQERVRARRNGKAMELDLLLVNGEALVIVEVVVGESCVMFKVFSHTKPRRHEDTKTRRHEEFFQAITDHPRDDHRRF